METIKKFIIEKHWFLIGLMVMLGAIILPLALGAKSLVYVDAKASGKMDGSSNHPYGKIQDAINKAKAEDREVRIRDGIYHENIKIEKGVQVSGTLRSKVTIIAKDSDASVVTMKDRSSIKRVTIRDGRHGVLVEEDARAQIINCKIISNNRDGVHAKKAKNSQKGMLEIYDSYIAKNRWSGVYSEKRKVQVANNEILENKKDGADFALGAEVSLESNRLAYNDGVGVKIRLDDSKIWFKKNNFYDNGRDGIEIRAEGKTGNATLNKNRFYKNDRYGIARVEKRPFSDQQWNGAVIIKDENLFWKNKLGNFSNFINLY